MAVGSGIGSQIGWSAESTVNTRVAATKFLRAHSHKLDRVAGRTTGQGIQTGAYGPLAAHHVETHSGGSASFAFDVQSKGLGVLLNTLMGGSVTPTQQAATTAYLQTHTLADTYGKSMTIQAGYPYRGGTAVCHELTGCKVTAVEFACSKGEALTAQVEVDAMGWSDSQSLATASYSSTNMFHFGQLSVKLGTYASESAVTGVEGVSVRIERPHDTEAWTAGAPTTKLQPVLNDSTSITGTISASWLDKATFQDLAKGTTSTSLVFEWVGPLIASTYYETFKIVVPGATFEPSTQGVDGRDALRNDWSFFWNYDGTNQPVITYTSTDTAL